MKLIVRALLLLSTSFATTAFAANIEFTGYYEGYYLYNMNTPQSATGDAQNTGRFNDRNHNQFTTNLIELGAKGAATKNVSYTLEVGYGDLNEALHPAAENRDLVNQGYITVLKNGWSIDVGRFYSHIGFETAKAKDNWNFSRSLNYSVAQMHWGEGVRANVYDSATVGVNAYIYNGSDISNDNNDGKSVGARVRYSPARELTVNYNVLYGPERLNTESDARMTHNVTAKWDMNPGLSLGGELTLVSEDNAGGAGADADWMGLAAYAKFALSSTTSVTGRFEHADDDDGVASTGASVGDDLKYTTLTGTIAMDQGEGLTTWAELRHDSASEDVIQEDSNDTSDSQITALVGLTYAL